jgi:hypothetical protein
MCSHGRDARSCCGPVISRVLADSGSIQDQSRLTPSVGSDRAAPGLRVGLPRSRLPLGRTAESNICICRDTVRTMHRTNGAMTRRPSISAGGIMCSRCCSIGGSTISLSATQYPPCSLPVMAAILRLVAPWSPGPSRPRKPAGIGSYHPGSDDGGACGRDP